MIGPFEDAVDIFRWKVAEARTPEIMRQVELYKQEQGVPDWREELREDYDDMTNADKLRYLDDRLEEVTKDIYMHLDVYSEDETEAAIECIRNIKKLLDSIDE